MMLNQFRSKQNDSSDGYAPLNESTHDLVVGTVEDSLGYMFEVAASTQNKTYVSRIVTSLLSGQSIDESIQVLENSARNRISPSWPVYDQLAIKLRRLQNLMTGNIDELKLERILIGFDQDLTAIKAAVKKLTTETISAFLRKQPEQNQDPCLRNN